VNPRVYVETSTVSYLSDRRSPDVVIAANQQLTGIVKTFAACSNAAMSQPSTRPTLYKGYRFPPAIISYCVWLYYRLGLSLRDVSELMLARVNDVAPSPFRLCVSQAAMMFIRSASDR